jgi:flagellar biosynthesis protein FlhG
MGPESMRRTTGPVPVDQAAGLRRMLLARPGGCITLAAASPHAGHAALAAELALAMSQEAADVLLVDASDDEHGAAAWLGAAPAPDLHEALRGARPPSEISVQRGRSLRVVRARRALAQARPAVESPAGVLGEALHRLGVSGGATLLIAPAGAVAGLTLAERLLLVTRDDPDGITRSYALLKRVAGDLAGLRVDVALNGVRAASHAQRIFGNLRDTASAFLDLSLACIGWIPDDVWVQRAAAARRPVMELFPHSPAAVALRACAAALLEGVSRRGAARTAAASH